MAKFIDLFSKRKIIIGMIHLPPLPGTAAGKNASFKDLKRFAIQELEALEAGGVDAVIVENFWDLPYFPDKVETVTVAAMASVAGCIVDRADIPVGINVLYNDYHAEIAIARSVGASFIRAEVFVDPAITDTGLIPASSAWMIRERAALNAEDIAILADVHGKNTQVMWNRDVTESAMDAEKRGLADGVIITGGGTGKSASIEDIQRVKDVVNVPLLAGSGVKPGTINALFNVCDGVIVGSYFKLGGNINAPTDTDRVRELVSTSRKGI